MNPKKAIKELEKQLRKDSENLVLRLRLAACYREVGRTGDAVTLYRSVAVAYHAQDRLAQAIAVCRSVLEIEPTQPETQRLLAELDYMRKDGSEPGVSEQGQEQDIPSLAPPPSSTTAPPKSLPERLAQNHEPNVSPQPTAASSSPSPLPARKRRSSREFGPGSGMTPRHDRPEGQGPSRGLRGDMAQLRDNARARTPAPASRSTQPMAGPPARFSGPLLTPTPLPEPLALHDLDDGSSAPRLGVKPELLRPTLRGAAVAPPSPPPTPPRRPAPLPRPVADKLDQAPDAGYGGEDDDDPADDAMTRIADAGFDELLGGQTTDDFDADFDADFDGHTSRLPDVVPMDDPIDDDVMTRIAPNLPIAAPQDVDDAMTSIADESGLFARGLIVEPQVPKPRSGRANERLSAASFSRATPPIVEAASAGGEFDDLPTGADGGVAGALSEDPALPSVAPPVRVPASIPSRPRAMGRAQESQEELTDELDSFRADIGESYSHDDPLDPAQDDDEDDFSEKTRDTSVEEERTDPGVSEGGPTNVKPAPTKASNRDSLRMERAFKSSFTDTLDRLAPDGAVIDVPLEIFRDLPEEALAEMARRMTLKHYPAGETIVREGEPGTACFVIAHGGVRILKRDPLRPAGDPVEVGRLGSGALFGEFALLADRRRHATVEASEGSEIYEIPRRLLRELAANYVEVGPALETFFRERLLANVMWTAPFFKPLEEDRRSSLLARFKPLRVETGRSIVREGEPAGGLYLVVLGSVEITKRVGDNRSVLLATLGEGAYFGEMSLLKGSVASASVTAVGPTELAVMSPKDFYEVVADNPMLWDEVRREANRRQLETNQIVTGETNVV